MKKQFLSVLVLAISLSGVAVAGNEANQAIEIGSGAEVTAAEMQASGGNLVWKAKAGTTGKGNTVKNIANQKGDGHKINQTIKVDGKVSNIGGGDAVVNEANQE